MYKYIDVFYEQTPMSDQNIFSRGSLFWTCFPYVFNSPRVIRFWKHRPTEHFDITQFDPSKEQKDPRGETEADEFNAITTYKRRPVILLSTSGSRYDPQGLRGGDYFLVAPLRSLRILETKEYKFLPEFVWNSIIYKYSSIFYLPESNENNIMESIILFERVTTLHCSWLQPCNKRLTAEALTCLNMWFYNFIYGSVPNGFRKDLEAYRNLMGENPKIKTEVLGMENYLKAPGKK